MTARPIRMFSNFVLLSAFVALSFSTRSAAASTPNAQSLLGESYASGSQFQLQDKIDFLARLTRTASEAGDTRTQTWCEELFRLASSPDMPASWSRLAGEKNALISLARVNPARAMQLFSSLAQEKAQPNAAGRYPEDVRAHAAKTIFPLYWNVAGLAGIPELQSNANLLAAHGEFAFQGMASILEKLAGLHSQEGRAAAVAIFRDALSAYDRETLYEDADEQFLGFMHSARPVVSLELYSQGLDVFVKHLTAGQPDSNENYQADVTLASGVIHFSSRSRLILFRVFPEVARINPKLAQDLMLQYQELASAGQEIKHIEQGVIEGIADQATQEKLHKQMAQSADLARIATLQQTNPTEAFAEAQKLDTPGARMIAYSSLLPATSNPDQAAAIYSRETGDAEKMADAQSKLAAAVILAKGAYQVNDRKSFSESTETAFQNGSLLFATSNRRAFDRPGYEELTGLVQFCAEHGEIGVVDRIRQITDPSLRAYLLLAAAKGLAAQPSASQLAKQ